MKKSLTHLPKHKQQELKLIREIILDDFQDTQMIVLFGSYARGDWAEEISTEGRITYEYKSDYDILVITSLKQAANDHTAQSRVENRILNRPDIKTPTNLIYHTIQDVNTRLGEGHYFFCDIKKEGILLYDSTQFKLARIRRLNPTERKRIAEEDFKQWSKSAKEFITLHESSLTRRRYKEAAFLLHQATERFYTAVQLVFDGYKPKTHNIETLAKRAAGCDPAFLKVFPRATADQDHSFKQLKKAYIDARYKKSYRITKKELDYLAARVKHLQRLTQKVCKEKIERIETEDGGQRTEDSLSPREREKAKRVKKEGYKRS